MAFQEIMESRQHGRRKIVKKSVAKWRNTEADLIGEMADLLPYPAEVKATLNKPSIMRLSSAYIYLSQVKGEFTTSDVLEEVDNFVDVFGGFAFTLDSSGLILQVSPHVTNVLGHEPHELIGFNIAEFIHPDDQEDIVTKIKPKADPSLKVEFSTRMKYKTKSKANKTKQTGYVGMQVRGCLKKLGTTESGHHWLFVGACYPLCVVPCITLQTYEASFILKRDINKRWSDVYDWKGFIEYMGFDPHVKQHSVHRDGVIVSKEHIPYVVNGMKLISMKGSADWLLKFVTKSGHLIQWYNRFMGVFGSNGDLQFIIAHFIALRKDKFDKKLGWPTNKYIRMCPDYIGVPGEELFKTGAKLDSTFNLQNTNSMGNVRNKLLRSVKYPGSKCSRGYGSRVQHPNGQDILPRDNNPNKYSRWDQSDDTQGVCNFSNKINDECIQTETFTEELSSANAFHQHVDVPPVSGGPAGGNSNELHFPSSEHWFHEEEIMKEPMLNTDNQSYPDDIAGDSLPEEVHESMPFGNNCYASGENLDCCFSKGALDYNYHADDGQKEATNYEPLFNFDNQSNPDNVADNILSEDVLENVPSSIDCLTLGDNPGGCLFNGVLGNSQLAGDGQDLFGDIISLTSQSDNIRSLTAENCTQMPDSMGVNSISVEAMDICNELKYALNETCEVHIDTHKNSNTDQQLMVDKAEPTQDAMSLPPGLLDFITNPAYCNATHQTLHTQCFNISDYDQTQNSHGTLRDLLLNDGI